MLTRKFKGQLDTRIIELAFSRYLEKQEDLYNGNEIEIINPAGWFYDAYRDATKIYKAQRYANNKKKSKLLKNLNKFKTCISLKKINTSKGDANAKVIRKSQHTNT